MEVLALILFVLIFVLILFGFPVAFTLAGLSVIFGYFTLGIEFFNFLPSRIMGVMGNYVLIAVPLFIYMGIMLEKSGIAEELLDTMAILFGKVRGGLAISVIVVGAMLAASTGIVGATVITMGLISLPTMLKRNYSPELATGTIASSGTLGQIIPPSVVLVLLGSVLNVPVGDLFAAALLPGIILVLSYVVYILIIAKLKPGIAPAIPADEILEARSDRFMRKLIVAFILPFLLILAVLGSIFLGIASPTEAAAVGALGASILTFFQGKLTYDVLRQVMRQTTRLTCMVFIILLGATTFSLVFRGLGGDRFLVEYITHSNLSAYTFLFLVMFIVFVAGFFIDFIEIIFIIVPVVAPIFETYGMDLVWIGVLLALNLQTSFLTPPFGFSLFYLKGVSPPSITTAHLYRGIVPFILIQIALLIIAIAFPSIILYLVPA
jgi:tripartite ATP-independent transporter DctM subunit